MRADVSQYETKIMTSVFLDRTARTFRIVLSLIVASVIAVQAQDLGADLSAAAQRAEAEAQGAKEATRPTFQTSVNFVDVDVTVTDEGGQFVTGLTADDF